MISFEKWLFRNSVLPFLFSFGILVAGYGIYSAYLLSEKRARIQSSLNETLNLIALSESQFNRDVFNLGVTLLKETSRARKILICKENQPMYSWPERYQNCTIEPGIFESKIVFTKQGSTPLNISILQSKYVNIIEFLVPLSVFFATFVTVGLLFKKMRFACERDILYCLANDIETTPIEELSNLISLRKKAATLQIESAKHQLALQLAHDIRSPLSALNMLTSVIKDIPDDQILMLKNVSGRINKLANTLLQSSRVLHADKEQGNSDSSIDCTQAIETLINEKRLEFPNTEIRFSKNIRVGDRAGIQFEDLQRILSNLINNSIEANSSSILVELKSETIIQKIVVRVVDNGFGIPEDVIPRLGKGALSFGKEGKGNGLGISHAASILKKIGGEIKICSQKGSGTLVELLIPSLYIGHKDISNRV